MYDRAHTKGLLQVPVQLKIELGLIFSSSGTCIHPIFAGCHEQEEGVLGTSPWLGLPVPTSQCHHSPFSRSHGDRKESLPPSLHFPELRAEGLASRRGLQSQMSQQGPPTVPLPAPSQSADEGVCTEHPARCEET